MCAAMVDTKHVGVEKAILTHSTLLPSSLTSSMCFSSVCAVLLSVMLSACVCVDSQERPSLSVLFPVVSRVVDPGGRLHTSQLTNWVYGSSRLSSAVAEAVAALTEVAPGSAAAAAAAGGEGRGGRHTVQHVIDFGSSH